MSRLWTLENYNWLKLIKNRYDEIHLLSGGFAERVIATGESLP